MPKRSFKEYKKDLDAAFREGYQAGYNAKIADLRGARFYAKRGYATGVSAKKKHEKRMKPAMAE